MDGMDGMVGMACIIGNEAKKIRAQKLFETNVSHPTLTSGLGGAEQGNEGQHEIKLSTPPLHNIPTVTDRALEHPSSPPLSGIDSLLPFLFESLFHLFFCRSYPDPAKMTFTELDWKAINTIRVLAVSASSAFTTLLLSHALSRPIFSALSL